MIIMIKWICIAYYHEVAIISNMLSLQTEWEYRPALTGPGLWLTAMPCPDLLFHGRHPHDPRNYMDNIFTDPRGMEG